MSAFTNLLGNYHPALVHFPVALLTAGAAFEVLAAIRGGSRSPTGRTLLILGVLGSAAAVVSGLLHFDPAGYQGRTLEVARIHRILGLTTLGAAGLTLFVGEFRKRPELRGVPLWIYRFLYVTTAGVVGLTGHYGGWVVFGWGHIWTF